MHSVGASGEEPEIRRRNWGGKILYEVRAVSETSIFYQG